MEYNEPYPQYIGNFTDRYHIRGLLRRSPRNEVYLVIKKGSNEELALKIFRAKDKRLASTEYKRRAQIKRCEYIVKYRGLYLAELQDNSVTINHLLFIEMEHHKGESLYTILNENPRALTLGYLVNLFKQLVRALLFLHTNKVAHLGITLRNIISLRSGGPLIIDFGSSCNEYEVEDRLSHCIYSSDEVLAPELQFIHRCKRNEAIKLFPSHVVYAMDVWQLGLIFSDLLMQKPQTATLPRFTHPRFQIDRAWEYWFNEWSALNSDLRFLPEERDNWKDLNRIIPLMLSPLWYERPGVKIILDDLDDLKELVPSGLYS